MGLVLPPFIRVMHRRLVSVALTVRLATSRILLRQAALGVWTFLPFRGVVSALVGEVGIEPTSSSLSETCSTTELLAYINLRLVRDLHSRLRVLQTHPLAIFGNEPVQGFPLSPAYPYFSYTGQRFEKWTVVPPMSVAVLLESVVHALTNNPCGNDTGSLIH